MRCGQVLSPTKREREREREREYEQKPTSRKWHLEIWLRRKGLLFQIKSSLYWGINICVLSSKPPVNLSFTFFILYIFPGSIGINRNISVPGSLFFLMPSCLKEFSLLQETIFYHSKHDSTAKKEVLSKTRLFIQTQPYMKPWI